MITECIIGDPHICDIKPQWEYSYGKKEHDRPKPGMRGQFKRNHQNNTWVNGQSYQPEARAVSLFVDGGLAQNKVTDDGDNGGFDHALDQPGEIVSVVEDAVLLADEVNLREHPVEVLVYLVLLGQFLVLAYHALTRNWWELLIRGLLPEHVVHILLQNCPNNKR